MISGKQAFELHLATELSNNPVDDALALAQRIARHSPDAIRAAKQLLNQSAFVSTADGLQAEFQASARLMGTKNQIESIMAKLQKRQPIFADPMPKEDNDG